MRQAPEDRNSEKLSAEDLETQGRIIEEMKDLLRAFIAGEIEHEQLHKWAWTTYPGYAAPPVLRGEADTVLLALLGAMNGIEVPGADGLQAALRAVDAREYLEWLDRGVGFIGTGYPTVCLTRTMEQLEARFGRESHRMVIDGLGWQSMLRFSQPATSRAYIAFQDLEHHTPVEIHLRWGTDPTRAVRDLVELLALDDDELHWVDEQVDLSALPRWELDGHATFLSRARAVEVRRDLGEDRAIREVPG